MSHAAHFLVGPTAVGKTAVAQCLAEQCGVPILSADSMLVYRGMDIGTAKPTAEERGSVTYFGVDMVSPDVSFSVWDFRCHALDVLHSAPPEGCVIITGGTGLYIKSLTHGLIYRSGENASLREKWEIRLREERIEALQRALREAAPDAYESLVDKQNPRRLIRVLETLNSPRGSTTWKDQQGDSPLVGLWMEPDLLNVRIEQRVSDMYAQGLIAEVEQLLVNPKPPSKTALQAIGYAEAIELIAGNVTQAQAIERTVVRTRQLAKRQRTWFRNQAHVEWVNVTQESTVTSLAEQVDALWRKYGPTSINEG